MRSWREEAVERKYIGQREDLGTHTIQHKEFLQQIGEAGVALPSWLG
jgi:hypothetical protein